jgi:predicted O-methyltransferase YrrM
MEAKSLLTKTERAYLLRVCESASIVMEIGCFEGGTTKCLCQPGRTVYAIDPFPQGRWEIFNQHLAAELADGRAIVIRKKSADAFEDVKDVQPDVIFIDGDHSYAGVASDIKQYQGLVKAGGILIGDNYQLDKYHGLRKAVQEAFGLLPIECDKFWRVRL